MRRNFISISNEAPGLSTKRTGSSIDCAACLPSPFLARMNKPDRSQNRPSSRYFSPCQALAGSSSPRCSRRRSKPCSGADYPILRILCSVAPITRRSGKSRAVTRRLACNPRLRNAIHYLADAARRCDEKSKAKYLALKARGCSHARALRTIGDRLLYVACAPCPAWKAKNALDKPWEVQC